jgi:RNA polymerase sigma-70 factor (ECF subfamily)
LGEFRGGADDASTGALFRAWLTQVFRNVYANCQRYHAAAMRNGAVPLIGGDQESGSSAGFDPPADDPSPSEYARRDEQQERVAAALAKLPADERAVVDLHIFRELPLGQVAEQLGLTYDQVRYRLHNALGRLELDLGD